MRSSEIFMNTVKTKKKKFLRQNYFRLGRVGMKWRRPRGKQSKMRKSKKGKAAMPNIGYKANDSVRGLLRGYKPVMISNSGELEKMKQDEIAVISSGVGLRKSADIFKKAEELGVKIYNKRKLIKAKRHSFMIEKTRAEKEKMKHEKKTDEITKAAKKEHDKKESAEKKEPSEKVAGK